METTNETYTGFRTELRLSPLLITGILVSVGTAMLIVSEAPRPSRDLTALYVFCIVAYVAAGLTGLLAAGKTWIYRPLAIAVLLGVIYGGAYGLQTPAILALVGCGTLVAAGLISLPAAAITAVAEAAALVTLATLVPTHLAGNAPLLEPGAIFVYLAGLGIKLSLICAIYHRIFGLGQWLWNQFGQAQAMLAEARDQKAALQQALEDLVHANRQLALANERMAMLRAVAEEAQKSKTAFVAKVSHEFRTPLNMIIGLVALMNETPEMYAVDLSPEMRKDLQIVYRNCQHLTQMVNDVLNLTQVESGRLVLHRERLSLSEIISPAVAAVLPLLKKKQLSLKEDIPETLSTVYCDRTRVQQVVLNLVSNAARFTEEGRITIRAREADQMIVVEVADTGPGITPEDQSRIFEPFCQGTTELWRDTGGSGLGLTISRQFIEAHGGRIWLESERGAGTTFYFSLPVSDPVGPVARPGHWIQEDWTWRERPSYARFAEEHYRPRVIVYDAAGELQSEFARRQDAIDFVAVRSRPEMIEALETCPAHAVIVNEMESEVQQALIQTVRSASPTTPVVGSAVPPISARAIATGATGYLTKPVTKQSLVDILEAQDESVKQVLIVDDDRDVLSLFSRMLLAYDPALEVRTALGGRAALEELMVSLPDVVLLDLYMTDLDGRQVLEALREDARTADLPVYIVSAHDPTEEPPGSRYVLGAMGEYVSITKLLDCSLALFQVLLTADGEADRVLRRTPEERRVCSESQPHPGNVPTPVP